MTSPIVLWFVAALVTVIILYPAGARSAHAQSPVAGWESASQADKDYALALARRAFDTYVVRHEVIATPTDLPPLLRVRAAVFVRCQRRGAPVCCMGNLCPMAPCLAQEIIANAVAAAGPDRRFAPVKPADLGRTTLIVSIVEPPESISE